MKDKQLPPVRCDEEVLELVRETVDDTPGIATESEAIRHLLHLGACANGMTLLLFELLGGGDVEDIAPRYPDAVAAFLDALALKFEVGMHDWDPVETANSLGVELSPDTLLALHRLERGEAGGEDALEYLRVVPRFRDAVQEEYGEHDDLDDLEESLAEASRR